MISFRVSGSKKRNQWPSQGVLGQGRSRDPIIERYSMGSHRQSWRKCRMMMLLLIYSSRILIDSRPVNTNFVATVDMVNHVGTCIKISLN